MSKNTRNRILLTALAALLLVTLAVGGTMAYLSATTDTVKNTFKPNDVTAEIKETDAKYDEATKTYTKEYQFIPGVDLTKDPKVIVTATVDAYVFVKMEVSNWAKNNMATYKMADGWTELTTYPGVYYKDVPAGTTAGEYQILAGNKIEVSEQMTAADMPTGNATMTFKAWAIQKAQSGLDGSITPFTPEAAYKQAAGITE